MFWGFGGVVALAAAGYYHEVVVGGLPMMVILLCASTFFIEGGFSNLAPYTVESYGVNLGARASGLGQAANGVGKILGPLSLALIAGTSNILSPKATADAVLPAYLFLAFCMALVGLSFLILAGRDPWPRDGVDPRPRSAGGGQNRSPQQQRAKQAGYGPRGLAANADAACVFGPIKERRVACRGALTQGDGARQHKPGNIAKAVEHARARAVATRRPPVPCWRPARQMPGCRRREKTGY